MTFLLFSSFRRSYIKMLFVIVTCRSLFWILCSVGTFMLTFTALATPKWIIAKEKEYKRGFNNSIIEKYKPTLGLYNRCIYDKIEEEGRCIVVPKFALIPGVAWRACIIFLAAAVILLAVAAILAVISFCKQIVRRKSLMNLAGIMQAIAGYIFVVVEICRIIFELGNSFSSKGVFEIMLLAFYNLLVIHSLQTIC